MTFEALVMYKNLNTKILLTMIVVTALVFSFRASAGSPYLTAAEIKELTSEFGLDAQQRNQLSAMLKRYEQVAVYRGPVGTATLSGTVTTSAVALSGHQVTLWLDNGASGRTFVDQQFTDGSGAYSFSSLSAGLYYVTSGNATDSYIDYIWAPLPGGPRVCSGCELLPENQINVVDAATVTGINFDVDLGASMTGNISDATALTGVDTFSVELVNTDTNAEFYFVFSEINSATGDFTVSGVPAGNYRVLLNPLAGNQHIPQIYGGPECNGCNILISEGTGTVVTLTPPAVTTGINFNVNIGASISGRIVDSITLNATPEIGLVMIFNQLNYVLGTFIIDGTNQDALADGSYSIGGLLPGSYYVQGGDLGRDFYQRELYANRPCYWSGCDRGLGDAVTLSAAENRIGVNFLLDKGGKISGSITDAITTLPVISSSGVQVQIYNGSGMVVGGGLYDSNTLTYRAARALPAGSYAVRTGSMFTGDFPSPYVAEKYNNIPCPGVSCDLTTADVAVTTDMTTTGIDFALDSGFSFSGTVTELTSTNPIPDVYVLVYDSMGNFANSAITSDGSSSPIGSFEVTGLPAGTYYARTNNGSDLPFFGIREVPGGGWIDILYNGIACPGGGCDVTTGTPIVLGGAPDLRGAIDYDFTLTQGATISGQIVDVDLGSPIPEVMVNVFDADGESFGRYETDSNGRYTTSGLPAGTYYLTTSSLEVLVDVAYGGSSCAADGCDFLDSLPVVVTEQQALENIDMSLQADFIFSGSFDQ